MSTSSSFSSIVPEVPPLNLPLYADAPRVTDGQAIIGFRADPSDEGAFRALETQFTQEPERLITVLCLRAAVVAEQHPDEARSLWERAANTCGDSQADNERKAGILASLLHTSPSHQDAAEALTGLYTTLGWHEAWAELTQWRLEHCIEPDAPERGRLWLELGDHLQTQCRQPERALAAYTQALEYPICTARARTRMVDIHLRAGALDAAAAILEAELELLEGEHDAARRTAIHLQLAHIASERGDDLAEATGHLDTAIASLPDDPQLICECADMCGRAMLDDAAAKLRAAQLLVRAAGSARDSGDVEHALQWASRGLELDPTQNEALVILEALAGSEDAWPVLEQAFRERLAALDAGPQAAALHLRWAIYASETLARPLEARLHLERAWAMDPSLTEAYQRLYVIYERGHEWYALAELIAARYPEEARDADADHLDGLLAAARIHEKYLDDGFSASQYYYRVLAVDLFNDTAAAGYKSHWVRRHAWPELRKLLRFRIKRATSLARGDESGLDELQLAEEYVELADVLERRLGDVDGALATWREFAERFPEDTQAETQIARIEKRVQIWDNMIAGLERDLEASEDREARAELCARLAQLYRDRRSDPTRAIELYEEHAELSGSTPAHKAIVALLERKGDHEAILHHLEAQADASESNSERMALSRRAGDLAYHGLTDLDKALELSEALLALAPKSTDALHRMASIHAEKGDWSQCAAVLERELEVTSTPQARAGILRRIAEIHGGAENPSLESLNAFERLVEQDSHDAENRDALAQVRVALDRTAEAAIDLETLLDTPRTPRPRQCELALRLADVLASDDDEDGAVDMLERALRWYPHHPAALAQASKLYRSTQRHTALERVLAVRCACARDAGEFRQIAWTRVELLSDELDDPAAAAKVLLGLAAKIEPARDELNARLLQELERARSHDELSAHCELLLVGAAGDIESERELHQKLTAVWEERGQPGRARLSQTRFVAAHPHDIDGLIEQARLAELAEETEHALSALQQLSQLYTAEADEIATLQRMAGLAESMGDAPRALDLLRRAIRIDFQHEATWNNVHAFVAEHDAWPELIELLSEKLQFHLERGELSAQRETCLECADIARERMSDANSAFDWCEKAFFLDVRRTAEREHVALRLRDLAETDELWPRYYELLVRDIEEQRQRPAEPADEAADQRTEASREHEGEQYDACAAYVEAATIAQTRLEAPARGLALLEAALEHFPNDEQLTSTVESIARAHHIWPPLLRVHIARSEGSSDPGVIFSTHTAVSEIFDEQLGRPKTALAWLRLGLERIEGLQGEGREHADGLIASLRENIVDLARRREAHEFLALHLDDLALHAKARGEWSLANEAALDAAELYRDALDDPCLAARCLASRIVDNPDADHIVETVRGVAQTMASADENRAELAGLIELEALAAALRNADSDDDNRVELLAERARIRENINDDAAGAIAEWLRVLELDRGDLQAHSEVQRLASLEGCHELELFYTGWQLQSDTDMAAKRELYGQLAEIYENRLDRTEYALRARLQLFRLEPSMPTQLDDARAVHGELWRLAASVGEFRGPALPSDKALLPTVPRPEHGDLDRWNRQAMTRDELFMTPSAQGSRRGLLAAPDPLDLATQDELDEQSRASDAIDSSETASESASEVEQSSQPDADVEDVEDIDPDDLEFIDVDIIEVESEQAGERAAAAPPLAPPVALEQLYPGCPRPPRLEHTILPPRPECASAWAELCATFDELSAAKPQLAAHVHLINAFVWDQSAQRTERAFEQLERALLIEANWPPALEAAEALAQARDARPRLIQAYDWLVEQAHRPDDGIQLAERLAQMLREDGDKAGAERYYKKILELDPTHSQALEAMSSLASGGHDAAQFAALEARVLDLRRHELPSEERIERAMKLVELYATTLERRDAALDRLRILLTDHPEHHPAHVRLIELLVEIPNWAQAIEAMRNAMEWESEDVVAERWREIAGIYDEKLELLDRAIDAWRELATLRPEDEQARRELMRLYELTQRGDKLLELIDEQLLQHPDDGQTPALRLYRAETLLTGMEMPEVAQRELELLGDISTDFQLVVRKCKLLRALGLGERAQTELNSALEHCRDTAAVENIALELADGLYDPARDPKREALDAARTALAALERAADKAPASDAIHARRMELAELTSDRRCFIDAMGRRNQPALALQAAQLAREELGDRTRALDLAGEILSDGPRRKAAAWTSSATAEQRLDALSQLLEHDMRRNDPEAAQSRVEVEAGHGDDSVHRAEVWALLGQVLSESSQTRERARKAFDEAQTHDPHNFRSNLGLATLQALDGDLEAAERRITTALEQLDAPPPAALMRGATICLADILERTGRGDEAFQRLNAIARQHPNDISLRAAIAQNRFSAQRHRDVLNAASALSRIATRPNVVLTSAELRDYVRVCILAARCEIELLRDKTALGHLDRALELAPEEPAALELRAEIHSKLGRDAQAASDLRVLIATAQSASEAVRHSITATRAFLDASSHLALQGHAADDPEARTGQDLRSEGLAIFRAMLELRCDNGASSRAVHLCAPEQLDRIDDLAERIRDEDFELAVAGHMATSEAGQYDARRSHAVASGWARLVSERPPDYWRGHSPELRAHIDQLLRAGLDHEPRDPQIYRARIELADLRDDGDTIERLVQEFAAQLPESDSALFRVTGKPDPALADMLLRAAEQMHARGDDPARGLAWTASMDLAKLTPDAKCRLERYLTAISDTSGGVELDADAIDRRARNLRDLLAQRPSELNWLRRLADIEEARNRWPAARAVRQISSWLDPSDEHSARFSTDYPEQYSPRDGVDLAKALKDSRHHAGLPRAMAALWEDAHELISEHLGLTPFAVPGKDEAGQLPDSIDHAWRQTLALFGSPRVIVNARHIATSGNPSSVPGAQLSSAGLGAIRIEWSNPRVVSIDSANLAARGAEAARFAFARVLYLLTDERVLTASLDAPQLTTVLSAALQAFHPRHTRRRHADSETKSSSHALGLALTRRMSIRVARQIDRSFKAHADDYFDSATWRSEVFRTADKAGLAAVGDMAIASKILLPPDTGTHDTLRELETSPRLRSLVGYALSEEFLLARREMGFEVSRAH